MFYETVALYDKNWYNFTMLTEAFPKLNQAAFVRLLHEFFRSPYYGAVVVLLMACSELFSLEIFTFYCYLAFGLIAAFFDEDLLAFAPLVCCGYMTISAPNNVGKFPDSALMKSPQFTVHFVFLFSAAGIAVLARLIVMLTEREKRGVPRLVQGMLLIGIAYVTAGAFGATSWTRSAGFGAAQFVSLAAAYFALYYTVNWKTVPKDYFVTFMTVLGAGIAVEVMGMYALPGAVVDGVVNRGAMFTGWGIYNNVGAVAAMTMPAPFYFAATRRHGWLFSVLGTCYMLAVALSQSRGAMLFGAAVYAFCAVATLLYSKGAERKKNIAVFAAVALALIICFAVFKEKLGDIFSAIADMGMESSGRKKIYAACWEKFLSRPLFGVGFYDTPGGLLYEGGIWDLAPTPDDVFIPPRAHNTYFQLIASGGAFALFAYFAHRIETLWLVFRRPTPRKTFLGLCVLALLLTSFVDCHFFNFGPVIIYSALLLFIEKDSPADKRLKTE